MTSALRDVGSVCLRFIGVGLSPGGVIACAVSVDGAADRLRQRLEEELGDDGWLEHTAFENGRDPIWYCTPRSLRRADLATEKGRHVERWADRHESSHYHLRPGDAVYLVLRRVRMAPRTVRIDHLRAVRSGPPRQRPTLAVMPASTPAWLRCAPRLPGLILSRPDEHQKSTGLGAVILGCGGGGVGWDDVGEALQEAPDRDTGGSLLGRAVRRRRR